ncbi:50S ribosomal protein L18 [Candidatus Uhrbacteria bacterium]|nr:50S ribosomal protein L18 [Candidatus Uhrbacteria bacterium]
MSLSIVQKHKNALRRAIRTRARIHGTAECPRLSVKRSLKHIYVQLINDDECKTLAAASDKDVKEKALPLEVAKLVGIMLGKKAESLGIKKAVFDRGSYRYHGRVAAVADGARETGLTI